MIEGLMILVAGLLATWLYARMHESVRDRCMCHLIDHQARLNGAHCTPCHRARERGSGCRFEDDL